MLISIFCTVLSMIGIYGYIIGNNFLFIIGIGTIVIELLYGIITNQLKTIQPFIISAVIGIIYCKKIWIGIGIGLCFGRVIMFLLGLILMLITTIFIKKQK